MGKPTKPLTQREYDLILKCIRTFENNCSDEMRENWQDVIYDIEGSFKAAVTINTIKEKKS